MLMLLLYPHVMYLHFNAFLCQIVNSTEISVHVIQYYVPVLSSFGYKASSIVILAIYIILLHELILTLSMIV